MEPDVISAADATQGVKFLSFFDEPCKAVSPCAMAQKNVIEKVAMNTQRNSKGFCIVKNADRYDRLRCKTSHYMANDLSQKLYL